MVNGGYGESQAAAPVSLAVESCFIQQQFPCFSLSVSIYSLFNRSSFLEDKKEIQISLLGEKQNNIRIFVWVIFLFFSLFILFDGTHGSSYLSFL